MWGEAQADKARAGGKKKRGKKKKKKGKARITSISTHAGSPPPGLTKFSPEEAENQKAMMKRLFKQVCDSCGKSKYDKLKKCFSEYQIPERKDTTTRYIEIIY